MDKTQLKFTDDLAEKIKGAFASEEFKKTLEDVKKSITEDSGTFRMVISTDHEDRHGEVIDQNGWEFANYMLNPVVLWGHNHFEIPVGVTDKLYIELDETGTHRRTIAEGRFASHEFAQVLRKLYDEKMVRTSSVGFLPKEYNGNRIIKAELLEWSFVSIPANQFAISLNEIAGFSRADLIQKGLLDIEKKEGDVVETTDEEDVDIGEEEEEKPKDEKEEEEKEAAEIREEEAKLEDADETEEGDVDDVVINDEEKTLTINTGKKVFKFKMTDSLAETLSEKAGRIISGKNLSKLKDAHTALQEVIELAESSDEEGKAIVDDANLKGRDEKSREVKEAEDFLAARKDLQKFVTVIGEALAETKLLAKSKSFILKSSDK